MINLQSTTTIQSTVAITIANSIFDSTEYNIEFLEAIEFLTDNNLSAPCKKLIIKILSVSSHPNTFASTTIDELINKLREDLESNTNTTATPRQLKN